MSDDVNHPTHYNQSGIEAIDAIEAAIVNLKGAEASHTFNAMKYLWRWKEKGGVKDLHKAQWYISRLIKQLEPE